MQRSEATNPISVEPGLAHYTWMRRLLATENAHQLYRKRQVTVEPVFGQTVFNRKLTRFHRRGRGAVRSEWRLIAATHNLLKLHTHQMATAGPETGQGPLTAPTTTRASAATARSGSRSPLTPRSTLFPTATARSGSHRAWVGDLRGSRRSGPRPAFLFARVSCAPAPAWLLCPEAQSAQASGRLTSRPYFVVGEAGFVRGLGRRRPHASAVWSGPPRASW
jgi:hypothetical protein